MSLQTGNKSRFQPLCTHILDGTTPAAYAAMLSGVVAAFERRIIVLERMKDGLLYTNTFTGHEAVDVLCQIIETTDRTLALLLGRALDAQFVFRNVTYQARLLDSREELYRFEDLSIKGKEVSGVFTLLTQCYSPTCTPEGLCYSVTCPKRYTWRGRTNTKPVAYLTGEKVNFPQYIESTYAQKLWMDSIPKEMLDNVPIAERKRQEIISELCYTERDFCKDLEYLRDYWIYPLRSQYMTRSSPIPEQRRDRFIQTVFSNCLEIYTISKSFAKALTVRQQQQHIVLNIADLFLQFLPLFDCFVSYGANQVFGRNAFESEKESNAAFCSYVEEVERMKESRKLELNGYLTKPITRLARYPLFLESMLKYTAEENSDFVDIPKALSGVKSLLSRVNIASGKSEDRFNLQTLNQRLVWKTTGHADLKLLDVNRQLLFEVVMRKTPTDTSDYVKAYLFDHVLLFARPKVVNKKEALKVYRRPIPLSLLVISLTEFYQPRLGVGKQSVQGLASGPKSVVATIPTTDPGEQIAFPMTFRLLGKNGFEQTLYFTSQIQKQMLLEHVYTQQTILQERTDIFNGTLSKQVYSKFDKMRITCCVPVGEHRVNAINRFLALTPFRQWPNCGD